MIPSSYQEWRECIEVHCKIPLTEAFIRERLRELRDREHPRTSTFAELYGLEHLERTIGWFDQAASELSAVQ